MKKKFKVQIFQKIIWLKGHWNVPVIKSTEWSLKRGWNATENHLSHHHSVAIQSLFSHHSVDSKTWHKSLFLIPCHRELHAMMINIFGTYTLTVTQEIGHWTDHYTDRLNLSADYSMLSLFSPCRQWCKALMHFQLLYLKTYPYKPWF